MCSNNHGVVAHREQQQEKIYMIKKIRNYRRFYTQTHILGRKGLINTEKKKFIQFTFFVAFKIN